MEIIIKIPKEIYTGEQTAGILPIVVDAIGKGIPLPDHHGRLIDADAIKYTHAIARSLDDGHNWNELCVTENEIYDAPTIIEGSDNEC